MTDNWIYNTIVTSAFVLNDETKYAYRTRLAALPAAAVPLALFRAYHQHKKKLAQIRQDRKHQLTFDSQRLAKQAQIKHSKSRSFAHRYNEEHSQIHQYNQRLSVRLERMKTSSRYASHSNTAQIDQAMGRITPFKKKQLTETDKENARIYTRVKSAESDLKQYQCWDLVKG